VSFTPEEIQRFWAKVDLNGPVLNLALGPCWVWTGTIDEDGYGRWWIRGKDKPYFKAHRVSFSLENGPIPEGLFTCHRCDNRPCVRPSHLFEGDALANALDMRKKGRAVNNAGERHGLARLSDDEIQQIRYLVGQGRTQREIADAYGIDRSYVSHIKNGRYRNHHVV
jgi:DNA-binding CsgD family transcriptional regulator